MSWDFKQSNEMITNLQKEEIAVKTIKVLYHQIDEIAEITNSHQARTYSQTFLNSLVDPKIGTISLSSWMHGLNTSLGQSFFEKTAHILCGGTKREFTTKKKTALKTTQIQKATIADIITHLTNGLIIPDLESENEEISNQNEVLVEATDFTADVYFEDSEEIVCIESEITQRL